MGIRKPSAGSAFAARRDPSVSALVRDGWSQFQRGDLRTAKASFEQAIRCDASRADAWKGIGMVAFAGGAADAAVRILERAVALAPGDVEARAQLARAMQAVGQIEPARLQWQAITSQSPQDADAWTALGILEQGVGNTAQAEAAYRRADALRPSLATRAKLATLISPIIASREGIDAERRRMDRALDALLNDELQLPPLDDPMSAKLWTNFYLAYHGRPDRALQSKTSAMYRRLVPALNYVAPARAVPRTPGSPIRIGLISQFFYNHSIGRTSRGLFAQIDRKHFVVVAIFIAPVVDDEYARFIRAHADRTIVVPQDLGEARRLIEQEALDVLFYQDIGMEPFSYFLAHSRLAPVQCVSYGHPDTTGISTIDAFISNDAYEVPGAQDHYSERLYLLRGLGTLAYYYRPQVPEAPKQRADFGLSDSEHLYVCPQNLFKLHPDMDDLIAAILRRDPDGRVVMVAGKIAHWTDLVRQRFAGSMPDVVARIEFLPRMPSPDYVNLIAVCDVMLDTVHFNGMNTSLEALGVGTPVVTWPQQFQRSRHTQAMYRRMGLTDCIVDSAPSYVETAVRIASDASYREELRIRIMKASNCLFEDARAVREFERFFLEVAEPTSAAQR